MTLLGYGLGNSIPHIEKYIHLIILVVIFISFIPIFSRVALGPQEK